MPTAPRTAISSCAASSKPTRRCAATAPAGTEAVVGSYAARAEDRHIELRSELQAHTTVRGDRAQLALLISNVVDNALRYTQSRAKACVRLETLETRAVLQVADNGRGIPSNELTRIFERFYRIDKAPRRATGGSRAGA